MRKVASFCQLLEKRYSDKLDERGLEYIGFAVDGAKRMQSLINDLLTFSRVGRLNATHTEVNLDEALDSALKNLATAVGESGAEIERPDEPLPQIDGDPTLMAMLWQNLIGNAVKFRREGLCPGSSSTAGPVRVNWQRELGIQCFGQGIGIGEEFVDKVFVIFQRLHGRDAFSGTGIGLALCKKIVEHHGGSIWIDTAYSPGTRFMFTLPETPTTVPDVVPKAQLEANSTVTASVNRAIDILLVEDDPGDELITREAFEHNKIKNNLHVARDGEEGLDFLYRRGAFEDAPRPDLILLDLNLPKYDGRQLLEKIKSDSELCYIPIVVLTTSSAEEDILRSYKLHANAYVTKPVDLDQFIERGPSDRRVLCSGGAASAVLIDVTPLQADFGTCVVRVDHGVIGERAHQRDPRPRAGFFWPVSSMRRDALVGDGDGEYRGVPVVIGAHVHHAGRLGDSCTRTRRHWPAPRSRPAPHHWPWLGRA